MEDIRKKVFSGFIWRFLERIGAQGVGFIVSLFLARLLTPEAYGQVALVTIFITILNTFALSGIGTSLIQKKNTDELDYSTVFWFNIGFSFFLYIILFYGAPLIGKFYNDPSLVLLVRVLGISIIISGANNVQRSYVSKTMQFRRFFFSTIIGTIVSGIVGVIMAYKGMGIWAIVGQQLTNQAIDTLILWFTVGWRPKRKFSFNRLKTLYSFGWKLLVSSLLDTIYSNLYSLIIGKFYNAEILGVYNKGRQFPSLIVSNINGPIQSVLLPAMSSEQDNKKRVKEMTRRSIVTSSFFIFPMMIGMAAIAKPMVILLLTEKWVACVPFVQISCISLALYPIHTANLQAINALGRSDIFLKLEIIKKIVGLVLLVVAIPYGVYVMVWLEVLSGVIASFVNAYPNKKLLDYSYLEQIKDLIPSIANAMLMGGVVWGIGFLNINALALIILQIVIGACTYFGIAKLFKFECYEYLVRIFRRKRMKNK